MRGQQIDDEISGIDYQYAKLEKLLIEYAEPLQIVEKQVRAAEDA